MTTCLAFSERLSDYVDRALPPTEQRAVDAHLAECAVCRGAVQDLERLRSAARSLGPIAPPAIVWTNITAQMPSARRSARAQWLGLAAALVLVTVGAYDFSRSTTPAVDTPPTAADAGNAAGEVTVKTIEDELAAAAKHYETAITQLETIAKRDTSSLPPETAAKLQTTLTQIDKYIAESRAALNAEPQSEPARESLFGALRRKVTVLQDTVALMGAMSRGDQEEAAKIVGGKKS
jgi:hypothetical protein